MTNISEEFNKTLVASLHRKTLKVPSFWAEKCRIMGEPYPGPYTFKYHPWTKEMLNTDFEYCIGQKAAQMGFTETMLNRAFYTIDQLRRGVLYVLPNATPDAGDFSQTRFDPALELSEHLSTIFNDVDKVGLKRSGEVSLYIRGSRSDAALKSIPVGLAILDESDEMEDRAVGLVKERLSGQLHKQMWEISTPTVPNHGINSRFELSTQEHYYFKCPYCNQYIEFLFPESLVIVGDDPTSNKIKESHLICYQCKHIIAHEEKNEMYKTAKWEPTFKDRMSRGFTVNQLYSTTVKPYEIAQTYLLSLSNPVVEQEFFNSKLGKAHVVAGSRITESHIRACVGQYQSGKHPKIDGPITMGVDVGKHLHIEVATWVPNKNSADPNDAFIKKVIYFGKIERGAEAGFVELFPVLRMLKPHFVVIDAMPELRSAESLCFKTPNIVRCYYNESVKAKTLSINDEERVITVNRTSWLDQHLYRFRDQTVVLPIDIDEEYIRQNTALTRVYKNDKKGKDISMYVGNAADHYAHAGVYNEIAFKILMKRYAETLPTESPI